MSFRRAPRPRVLPAAAPARRCPRVLVATSAHWPSTHLRSSPRRRGHQPRSPSRRHRGAASPSGGRRGLGRSETMRRRSRRTRSHPQAGRRSQVRASCGVCSGWRRTRQGVRTVRTGERALGEMQAAQGRAKGDTGRRRGAGGGVPDCTATTSPFRQRRGENSHLDAAMQAEAHSRAHCESAKLGEAADLTVHISRTDSPLRRRSAGRAGTNIVASLATQKRQKRKRRVGR